jgi:hypothetical protein
MSAVSFREKNLLIIVAVLALYALAALSYKKQMENWRTARQIYENAQKKLQEEKDLIAVRNDWNKRYEQMQSLMPVFPEEKDVDTHWLNTMEALAEKNNLTISRRQAGEEVSTAGDVFELPIECKDWEGTLESLVKFLYDLHLEGAMLDVRNMFIRPSSKAGYLKGTFSLYCAYMRGEEQRDAVGGGSDKGGGADEKTAAADKSDNEEDGAGETDGQSGQSEPDDESDGTVKDETGGVAPAPNAGTPPNGLEEDK